MAADGKWVEGLTADTKWADAATRVLSARLDAVQKNWQQAIHELVDAEPVHQLRVATRRAKAAAQIFADVLPKRTERELSQLLKKLRKIAGAARDWDVFNLNLRAWAVDRPANEHPGLDFLSGMALGQRELAQTALERSEGLREAWEKLLPKIKPQRGKRRRLGQKGSGLVFEMLAEFQTAIKFDPSNADRLHQIRIAGKRLRYALELFVDVLDAQVRDRMLPLMEDVQDILGLANDARNLRIRIKALNSHLPSLGVDKIERYSPGVNAWFDQLGRDADAGLPRFREWLLQWQTATESYNNPNSLNTNPN